MITKVINNEWESLPIVHTYRRINNTTKDKTEKRTIEESLTRISLSKNNIDGFINLLKNTLPLLKNSYMIKVQNLEKLLKEDNNQKFKTNIYDTIPSLFDDYGDPINVNKYNIKRLDVILLENDIRIKEILNGV